MSEEANIEPLNPGSTEETMLDSRALVDQTLSQLGFHASGEAVSPDEGLIASNYFIDTAEQGEIVIRANSTEAATQEGVSFETRALDFLGANGVPVPALLQFTDGSIEKIMGENRVIAYVPISGETLSSELDDKSIAHSAGILLQRMLTVSGRYEPSGDEPSGDEEFIEGITHVFLEKYPNLSGESFFKDALAIIGSEEYRTVLAGSPQGIVHADFFYENIIVENGDLNGIIDFGDAYYGALVNDIAIGAMEFSVLEGSEQWKPELFKAFIQPSAEWLVDNNIDYASFKAVLLANCLRFAVYTLGFELESDPSTKCEGNRYVRRFYKFRDNLTDALRSAYEEVTVGND